MGHISRMLERYKLAISVLAGGLIFVLAYIVGSERGYHNGVVAGYRVGTESALVEQATSAVLDILAKAPSEAPAMVKALCRGFVDARTAGGCGSLKQAESLARSSDQAEELFGMSCRTSLLKIAAPCGL